MVGALGPECCGAPTSSILQTAQRPLVWRSRSVARSVPPSFAIVFAGSCERCFGRPLPKGCWRQASTCSGGNAPPSGCPQSNCSSISIYYSETCAPHPVSDCLSASARGQAVAVPVFPVVQLVREGSPAGAWRATRSFAGVSSCSALPPIWTLGVGSGTTPPRSSLDTRTFQRSTHHT